MDNSINLILQQTGFHFITIKQLIMILISFLLLYLGIRKNYEPLLLIPISFGMMLVNIPGSELMEEGGLLQYIYLGIEYGIYPPLIFIGLGAMTDFGPMLSNPKSVFLGAATQLGIFITLGGAVLLGFDMASAAAISIIGGANGPTAIYVSSILAPRLLGAIAIAAYSYMALVPIIQPPIMNFFTTAEERQIEMKEQRVVSRKEKVFFAVGVALFGIFFVPNSAPLIGCLMFGNLLRESRVVDRLANTAKNSLINVVTIFLGLTIGASSQAEIFLSLDTLLIIFLGLVAFAIGTASGVLCAKLMNIFIKRKINPLIGSAGVAAVPMAARVSQNMGQKESKSNHLLMHAMGPNVAGILASTMAAGTLLALLA